MKNSGNTKKTLVTGTIVLIAVVGAMMALYFSYGINKGPDIFFARSINDAAYDCENKIANRFEDDLISKTYDQISSRYEPDRHQYIIYYNISVRSIEDDVTIINDYLSKCIVWEKLGYVSDFQVFYNL